MSTEASSIPQPNENPRIRLSAFRSYNNDDPFLSATQGTEDELIEASKIAAAISKTPSAASSTASPRDFFGSAYTDLSVRTSPEHEEDSFLFGVDLGLLPRYPSGNPTSEDIEPVHHPLRNTDYHQSVTNNEKGYSGEIPNNHQLLSPVLTNTPSPSSDRNNASVDGTLENSVKMYTPSSNQQDRLTRTDIPAHRLQQPPPLITSPSSDNLHVEQASGSAHVTSPIVKVSVHNLGDSPTRFGDRLGQEARKRRQASLSSNHLVPGGDNLPDSEEDDDGGNQVNFVSMPVPSSALRADNGSWLRDPSSGQSGLDPTSRDDSYVFSPKEMEERRKREDKNADIKHWLSVSNLNDAVANNDALGPGRSGVKGRLRAKSAGASSRYDTNKTVSRQGLLDDSRIPGPGVLVDEESMFHGEDDDLDAESLPESLPANIEKMGLNETGSTPTEYFPPFEPAEGDSVEPLPTQFLGRPPWQDPKRDSGYDGNKSQPDTSNAAIMTFRRRAENIETASRRATWGTRRLSESDVNSITGPESRMSELSIKNKKEKERRPSLLDSLRNRPRKNSNLNMKKRVAETMQRHSSWESVENNKKDSATSPRPPRSPQRKLSFNRSKSPSFSTGGAVLAMTGQIATIGGGNNPISPMAPTSPNPQSPLNLFSHFKKRSRSKSEIPKGTTPSGVPGLSELMTNHGGPPVPYLVSPKQDLPVSTSPASAKPADADEDGDGDDDEMDEKGIVMDFPIRSELIIPNEEGFKNHALQLNPRLEPFLVNRIGQEQVRRYKGLVENRNRHVQAVTKGRCTAGAFCFALGGKANILPPRASAKDPDTTYAQFSIPGADGSGEESNSLGEAAVTPALFPQGVPLPPVKRLPAEFECFLCFKAKKFNKPSDWTKHVHEDVQPFTCTFPGCNEPKSFKRKADWVRHENERHRHLEWWTCNLPDCSHTCYRKDNFVQHLVREHKMPDPKVKTYKTRVNNSDSHESWQASRHEQECERVGQLVDECRHETDRLPKDEPCRFCGNVCSSWKKLTVHLAKHMEQLSLPVLELAKAKDTPQENTACQKALSHVSPISPIPASEAMSSGPSSFGMPMKIESHTPMNITQAPLISASPQSADGFAPGPFTGQLHPPASLGGHSQNQSGAEPYPWTPLGVPQYSRSSMSPIATQSSFTRPDETSQFAPVNVNSATYPPPYNAVPRQNFSRVAQGPSPVAYNTTISTQPTTFPDSQSIYASPTEGVPYIYQPSQGDLGQPILYDPSGMNYPMTTSQQNPATSQAGGYAREPGNFF